MNRKKLALTLSLLVVLLIVLSAMNSLSIKAAPSSAKPATPTPTPTPIATVPPGSYYVSVNGSDSNPGTEGAPWRHIQYAIDRVGPGSTIYVMNGVYNETVTFRRSGTAEGGYITLRNYPGHSPVIDGTGIPISGETGLIVIENKAYIRVIGFEIRNLKAGGNSKVFPAGIWIRGNGAFLEIRNNRVHDIENSCRRCGAHGIAVYGRDPNASIHDIIIDGNEVYNGKFGWSESVVLNGNVEKFVVSNNIIHDNDNIGLDFIGFEGENPNPEVDRARDGLVVGNLVYNINSYGNPAYGNERSADGIYVDGGTRITIERNIVHDCNIGIELASEHAGKSTSYVTVRNNFVYNNTDAGIAIGGYDTRRGSTENCAIVNNTFYNNARLSDAWGAELYVQYDTRYNIIKNNIFYAGSGKPYILSWSPVMTGNEVDYNLFYNGASWQWKNVTYNTFSAYQSGTGNDIHSLNGVDPLFVNAALGNLRLQSTSPAINAGQNLDQSGLYDIDGNPRIQGGTIDIGAYEAR